MHIAQYESKTMRDIKIGFLISIIVLDSCNVNIVPFKFKNHQLSLG